MAITAAQKKAALEASSPREFAEALDIGKTPTEGAKRVRAKLRSMDIRLSQDKSAFNKTVRQQLVDFYENRDSESKETKSAKTSKKSK